MKPTSMALAVGAALPLLSSPVLAQFAAPAGIYALGSAQDNLSTPTDERLSGIRNNDFVSGFTLRVLWKDIETSQGVYNFGVISEAIRRTAANGQGLNLEVLQSLPQYIFAGASATYVNHRSEITPVPWDAFAQARFQALQSALSTYIVNDGTGLNLPLNQHPTLRSIDATPVGLPFGLRDLTNTIRNHPAYTRQRFMDAVTQGVGVARSAFPNHRGFLAFFGFNDGQPGVPVDQQLIALLDAQYNGPGQASLSFFIENLSDVGPVPMGGSGGTGNNLLAWSNLGGSTMMQALNSWLQPPANQAPQLVSRNPATGIALGYNTYGTRFFELYVHDLDGAFSGQLDAAGRPILDDLRFWNTFLTTPSGPSNYLSYCTAGTSTSGCVASLSASGQPRASASSGFALQATALEGNKQALFFYGISGRAVSAWGSSSSFLCVKSPTRRTPSQNSGGVLGSCSGSLALDWLAFVAANPTALGAPFASGDVVQAQAWYRDPPSPNTTHLSNALEFTLVP